MTEHNQTVIRSNELKEICGTPFRIHSRLKAGSYVRRNDASASTSARKRTCEPALTESEALSHFEPSK